VVLIEAMRGHEVSKIGAVDPAPGIVNLVAGEESSPTEASGQRAVATLDISAQTRKA